MVWAYNIVPADPYDLDQPLITPLVDLEIDGVMRKTALLAARDGYFYIWDRNTGEILNQPWMFEYTNVTLGVDTNLGRPIYNIEQWPFTHLKDRQKYTDANPWPDDDNRPEAFLEWTGTEVEYCPGTSARNWENDAYSPQTGLLYTATDTSCTQFRMIEGEYVPGESYRLREYFGRAATRKGLDGKPTTVLSKLMANDPLGSRTAWTKNLNTTRRAPVMATAGGLVFQGGNDTGVFPGDECGDRRHRVGVPHGFCVRPIGGHLLAQWQAAHCHHFQRSPWRQGRGGGRTACRRFSLPAPGHHVVCVRTSRLMDSDT